MQIKDLGRRMRWNFPRGVLELWDLSRRIRWPKLWDLRVSSRRRRWPTLTIVLEL
jgi:hypothetical protein